ncbi:TetR family transcriptional regulator [Novosphingobium sp. FSY-8]|uniref:TetR family transcriptional regulator n=1 Tax=Novosphingobium ovatum TaxID=1908523 RepID=A0ABW9X9B3_9SPHN|nr:TetR/AcrR family transcriptional regulator [Novosphingobium ovatum]NBC35125.1 TetR family transcriptional regulator [Novosphingobium ovatum]
MARAVKSVAGSENADDGAQRSRKPTQPRSRASLDRMLAAARRLMVERQSEDFTLQDVSFLGKVSIGSIYFRFQNKDDLVRAVIGQDLAQMATDETDAIAASLKAASSIEDFILAYVRAQAQIVKAHALMLRLAMRKAAVDRAMSDAGEQQEMAAVKRFAAALAQYGDQAPPNLEMRAQVVFHVLFATFARHISQDAQSSSLQRMEWDAMIDEISQMIIKYILA